MKLTKIFPDLEPDEITTRTPHGDQALAAMLRTLREQGNDDLAPVALLIMHQLYPDREATPFESFAHVRMLVNKRAGGLTPRCSRMLEMFGNFYTKALWWMHDAPEPRALTNQFIIEGAAGPYLIGEDFDEDAPANPHLLPHTIDPPLEGEPWTSAERQTFTALFCLAGATAAATEFFALALVHLEFDEGEEAAKRTANAIARAFLRSQPSARAVEDIKRFGGEDALVRLLTSTCRDMVRAST